MGKNLSSKRIYPDLRVAVASHLCSMCSSGVCDKSRTIVKRLHECSELARQTTEMTRLIQIRYAHLLEQEYERGRREVIDAVAKVINENKFKSPGVHDLCALLIELSEEGKK